jgi:hypothetical protein
MCNRVIHGAIVLLAVSAAGVGPRLRAQEETTFTEVPVLVNILEGVDVGDPGAADDAQFVEDIIKEANKILKQAKIRLKFDKGKDINTNFNDQGDNDDDVDSGEDTDLDKAARDELKDHTGKDGTGYKIVIANEIHANANTTGLSPHDPDNPVT